MVVVSSWLGTLLDERICKSEIRQGGRLPNPTRETFESVPEDVQPAPSQSAPFGDRRTQSSRQRNITWKFNQSTSEAWSKPRPLFSCNRGPPSDPFDVDVSRASELHANLAHVVRLDKPSSNHSQLRSVIVALSSPPYLQPEKARSQADRSDCPIDRHSHSDKNLGKSPV